MPRSLRADGQAAAEKRTRAEVDALIDRQLAAREPRPREVESWAADWRVEVEFGGR